MSMWWGSDSTIYDDDGLPVTGGGIVDDDGTLLAGEAPPAAPRPDVTVQRPAYSIPMSSQMYEEHLEFARVVADAVGELLITRSIDRMLNPWKYPDQPAIRWTFDPFPRWTRWVACTRGYVRVSWRVSR
jgi:hypothetical protein